MPYFPLVKPDDLKHERRYAWRFFKRVLNDEKFNGQFLVAKNGRVFFYKAQGYANYDKKKKIRLHTPMHVASVSKVATALCILRLADHKRIILDADIRRYLPEIPYSGISVRMLLNHRSGIPYYGYFVYGNWDRKRQLHNRDLLSLINKNKFPLNFIPDSKFSYSNTNFALLALIVEEVTGKEFPKAMREWIFDPIRMDDTFVLSAELDAQSFSLSYNSKFIDQGFNFLDAVYGDKNMYTTAHDLLKMDMATYSDTFLSDSLRKQMFKGYSYEHDGVNNYGLGIRMKEMKGRDPFFFHTGWWHGNTSCYSSMRSDTICVVALSNLYTRSVYNIGMLSVKFGNYPYDYSDNPLD
jgi:CubicO group peptidase (beta-lactamase class C family)